MPRTKPGGVDSPEERRPSRRPPQERRVIDDLVQSKKRPAVSEKLRDGPSQAWSELVAAFGLILTILGTLKARSGFTPMAVGLYITALLVHGIHVLRKFSGY